MLRSQIPARLRASRARDIARIPAAALKSMTRADLAARLLTAGEYRRRARQHGCPPESARLYADLAAETLATTDPGRAAALAKAAGLEVTNGMHEPYTGTHAHGHADNGVRGNPLHDHEHTHAGDSSHVHAHGGVRAGNAPPPAGKSAASGPLAKPAAPGTRERSVTIPTPALDIVSGSKSFAAGMTALIRQGLLQQAHREMGLVAAAQADLAGAGHLAKAEEYRRKAMVVSDPAARRGYEDLAKAELERAGRA